MTISRDLSARGNVRTGAAGNEVGDRAISRTETKPFLAGRKKLVELEC